MMPGMHFEELLGIFYIQVTKVGMSKIAIAMEGIH